MVLGVAGGGEHVSHNLHYQRYHSGKESYQDFETVGFWHVTGVGMGVESEVGHGNPPTSPAGLFVMAAIFDFHLGLALLSLS